MEGWKYPWGVRHDSTAILNLFLKDHAELQEFTNGLEATDGGRSIDKMHSSRPSLAPGKTLNIYSFDFHWLDVQAYEMALGTYLYNPEGPLSIDQLINLQALYVRTAESPDQNVDWQLPFWREYRRKWCAAVGARIVKSRAEAPLLRLRSKAP